MIDKTDAIDTSLEQIQAALKNERIIEALNILLDLHPADQAELFRFLDDENKEILLSKLDIPSKADLLEKVEDNDVLEAVEDLSTELLADLLDEMEPDEAADLLGDLPPEQVSEILPQMEDLDEVLPLLGYPDETAGGLMTTWYIAIHQGTTVEQAIDFLRSASPETDVPYYLFIVNDDDHLVGVVGLRELVISLPGATMDSIMDPEVIYVAVGVDQEEVAHVMSRYDLANLPVVDEQLHLVGVITHDDLVDVLEDEATEDILHMGAVEAGQVMDKPYWSQRIYDAVRSRFIWLLILFIGGMLTGTILRYYQTQLETVVALSFFMPLLIGTGGNAGSQTISIVIRALALREIKTKDALQVWWREARTGILLGILIGSLGYLFASIWGVSPELSLTVGLSVAAICVWSTSIASIIPIIAASLRIDPTVISAPLMSTLIDGTGLIIYFSLASLLVPQLR